MNTYCKIGARSGSKSIPNKNIQQINGSSLLRIAVEKALSSDCFDHIYVSCDDIKYKMELPSSDKVTFVLRPSNIAGDDAFEKDYIKHVVKTFNLVSDAIIARMQCTSPFQSIDSINGCIAALKNSSKNINSCQIIVEASPPVHKALIWNSQNGQLVAAYPTGQIGPSNRQGLMNSYFRSNFYAIRVSDLDNNEYLGPISIGYVGQERESLDIDTPLDLEIARSLGNIHPKWLKD